MKIDKKELKDLKHKLKNGFVRFNKSEYRNQYLYHGFFSALGIFIVYSTIRFAFSVIDVISYAVAMPESQFTIKFAFMLGLFLLVSFHMCKFMINYGIRTFDTASQWIKHYIDIEKMNSPKNKKQTKNSQRNKK